MVTRSGIVLTYGPNDKREPGRIHYEFHAPCGCAFHERPAPHWHPCPTHTASPPAAVPVAGERERVARALCKASFGNDFDDQLEPTKQTYLALAEEAIAALRAAHQPPQAEPWRTIESAPRDGAILVWSDAWDIQVCLWRGDDWETRDGFCEWGDGRPTHWMPLPPPPTNEATAKEREAHSGQSGDSRQAPGRNGAQAAEQGERRPFVYALHDHKGEVVDFRYHENEVEQWAYEVTPLYTRPQATTGRPNEAEETSK